MPNIKDLARTVVLHNWPIGDIAFDALWDSIANDPLTDGPIGTGTVIGQPGLGATGGRADITAIVARFFVELGDELAEDKELRDILPLLDAIGALLASKGIVVRVKKTLQQQYPSNTIIEANSPFAYAYTHEYPDGQRLTKKRAAGLLEDRGEFAILIYHEHDLPKFTIGKVYARTNSNGTMTDVAPRFSRIQYRLLRQLLKHRNRDEQRSLPALIEHCWLEMTTANVLRQAPTAQVNSSRYRTLFGRFKVTLQDVLGLTLISEKPSVYALEPWPETYCVIEEQPPN